MNRNIYILAQYEGELYILMHLNGCFVNNKLANKKARYRDLRAGTRHHFKSRITTKTICSTTQKIGLLFYPIIRNKSN